MSYQIKTGPLMANSHPGSYTGQDAYSDMLITREEKEEIMDTEYIVRRLTPTECARLQGFPDDWCHGLENPNPTQAEVDYWLGVWAHWAEINGTKPKSENQVRKWLADPHSDSEEYKLWGNGIALPCLLPMMRSMAHILEEEGSE